APQLRFAPETIDALERYTWPGNVRELRNVIERAAALCASDGGAIRVEHLPGPVREGPRNFTSMRPASATTEDVRHSLRELERQRIVEALQSSAGNQTAAAEMLGLPRRTLAYKMARLGIRAK